MDGKKGVISHFSGIIRIVAAVIIAICLIILFVRWANSRRQSNDSGRSNVDQSSQTQTQDKEESGLNTKDSSSDRQTASNDTSSTIPNGIDDSKSTGSNSNSVPATGINSTVLYTILLSLVSYLLVYNRQLKRRFSLDLK